MFELRRRDLLRVLVIQRSHQPKQGAALSTPEAGLFFFLFNDQISDTRCFPLSEMLSKDAYPPLRQRRREYEAPPPQVREQSLQAPQASHPMSLSSSERVILDAYRTQTQRSLNQLSHKACSVPALKNTAE